MQKQGKSARIALVGETLEVVKSENQPLVGLSGKVIDETKNTIRISSQKGIKTLIKDQVTIKLNNKTIDGKKLSGRIESRIKNS